MDYRLIDVDAKPTEEVDVRETFGIDVDMKVKAFAESNDRVPQVDHSLSARIGDGRVPVFRFRGAPEEGEALREALAAEFGLTS